MAEDGSDSTAREDSAVARSREQLGLAWGWPQPRVDRLGGARISLGRDEKAALRLGGTGVSRLHAELYRQGPIYVIRDLSSTNGTWVGGRAVEHAPVSPGTVLRIGDWVGVFTNLSEDAAPFRELTPGLFGGPEIAALLAPLARAAKSTLPVLLIGETGTGKERLARATHDLSSRSGPFFAVNCAALPEQLAEAELFGYRRGAFTGAERANGGYFRAAHGGTLFLDEMPELSLALQAKLLRVLEDGHVMSLGETTSSFVDVRIVSASQRPLRELVERGRLRRDLAARLSGLELRIPTLAQRRADIAPLFRHLLARKSGGRPPQVDVRLVEALCLYDWPDNVRELELMTRTLLAVHGHESKLGRKHLPPELAKLIDDLGDLRRTSGAQPNRRQHDLTRLKHELASNGRNIAAAALTLGISRQRIYRLLNDPNVHEGADDAVAD